LIVSLVYLGLSLVNEPENHPTWIKEAQFLPYVHDGAELLASWVPENMLDVDAWQGGTLGTRPAVAETLTPPEAESLAETEDLAPLLEDSGPDDQKPE